MSPRTVDSGNHPDDHYVTKRTGAEIEPAAPPLPDARTPVTEAAPAIGPRQSSAAGIASVLSTLNHAREEMGVVRGARALLRVNQKDGFDCQSCAWPNPEERHLAEFCENGAKAVAKLAD